MSQIMGYLNATALVIGYLVLACWVVAILRLGVTIVREQSIEWRLKDRNSREWDNAHSSWFFDETDRKIPTQRPYQKETPREHQRTVQGRREVRDRQLAPHPQRAGSHRHAYHRISGR